MKQQNPMTGSIPDAAGKTGFRKTVTYAVADIHGRLDLLEALLDAIMQDTATRQAQARIIFTGDYGDRGPDTYGVIERLIAGPRRPGDSFLCLRGNHDDLFIRCATTGEDVPDWAWFLFRHTLQSYALGVSPEEAKDRVARHLLFLSGLPLFHDDGRYLFVHAGIRPGVALADQTQEDLLWIRHEFLDYVGMLPRRVVHGHTIIGDTPVFTANRISADTGAFRSGVLTAIVLDDGEEAYLQAIGAPDQGAISRELSISEALLLGSFAEEPDRRALLHGSA